MPRQSALVSVALAVVSRAECKEESLLLAAKRNCAALHTNVTCNADVSCKFCQNYEQGWTFCANLTEDETGEASCDKSCSLLPDMYSCDSRSDCKWCSGAMALGGGCKANSYVPDSSEKCDVPLTGCGSLRANASCNADASCKFCQSYAQGWTFCANLTDDHSGAATCDKSCSRISDMYSCDSRSDCKWCSGTSTLDGGCHANTYVPFAQERCDVPSSGCGKFRTNTTCNADSSCKFCQSYAQGWTFCANLSDDHSGAATCDKACTLVNDMYSCDARPDCKWCSDEKNENGGCRSDSYVPLAKQRCDVPTTGCASLRTNATCNADAACKFCQLFEQGWTFCTNLTDDKSGSATCDKGCSALTDMYSCDSRSDCKWCTHDASSQGMCKGDAYVPDSQVRCDVPATGCASARTKSSCTAQQGCKFCREFEQGWTFCTNITDDRSGDADCNFADFALIV